MAWAFVVRSPHAHARISALDIDGSARRRRRARRYLTGADVIKDELGGLPCHAFPPAPAGSPHYRPLQPILATDKVRHVGDRVALVVAETLAQGQETPPNWSPSTTSRCRP